MMFGFIDILNDRYNMMEKIKKYKITDVIEYEVSSYYDLKKKIYETTETLKKEKPHDFIITNCNQLNSRNIYNSSSNKLEKVLFYTCYLYEDVNGGTDGKMNYYRDIVTIPSKSVLEREAHNKNIENKVCLSSTNMNVSNKEDKRIFSSYLSYNSVCM